MPHQINDSEALPPVSDTVRYRHFRSVVLATGCVRHIPRW